MPQNSKISQRRFLLDQRYSPRFRSMPSTESEQCRPPIPVLPKKWTPCCRNKWSVWLGTSGRHPSESMVGMGRNMQAVEIRPPEVVMWAAADRLIG
jgi:hypothetical protein